MSADQHQAGGTENNFDPATTDPADHIVGAAHGLARRNLFRGGVAAAAAAGLSVGAGVFSAPSAAAADGDTVKLGQANASSSSTEIAIDGAVGDPANATLSLTNVNGPSLFLNPLDNNSWTGDLDIGEIANTQFGPVIGLDAGDGTPQNGLLITDQDLAALPQITAIPPVRILDLRTSAGRAAIVDQAAGALDAAGHLNAGKWIDVKIADIAGLGPGLYFDAVYLTLTVTGSTKPGFLTLYPPTPDNSVPVASNLNWAGGQTVGNLAFSAVGTAAGNTFAVRIYASQVTWVIVDVNGAVTTPMSATPNSGRAQRVQAATVKRQSAISAALTAVQD